MKSAPRTAAIGVTIAMALMAYLSLGALLSAVLLSLM
jgi:hypothetical protein